MFKSLARAFGALLLAGTPLAAGPSILPPKQRPSAGVVVEKVEGDSVGGKAGIKPGDVLLSWERAANPPANPTPARGDFQSPFDLRDAAVEQSQRGRVTLRGRRGGSTPTFEMPPGLWGITARSQLSEKELVAYLDGKGLTETKRVDKGVAVWLALAQEWSLGGDHNRAVWIRAEVAQAFSRDKRFEEARKVLAESLQEANENGLLTAVKPLWRMKAGAFGRHEYEKAADAYQQILRICEKESKESIWTALALHELGLIAGKTGNPAEAEAFFRRALLVRERLTPGSFGVGSLLGNLAIVRMELGDFASAEKYARAALAINQKLQLWTGEFQARLNLGDVLSERGDLAGAEALFRQTLAIAERESPGTTDEAVSLGNLGTVAFRRGDLAAAERYHLRDLAIEEKDNAGNRDHAESLSNLGDVSAARGDFALAESYYRRALEIQEKRAPETLEVTPALDNLGALSLRRGDLKSAQAYFDHALAIQENLAPGGLETAQTLNGLGDVAKSQPDLTGAHQFYTRSLAIREKLAPESQSTAETLHNLGLVHRGIGNLSKAASFLRRAVDTLELQKRRLGGAEEVRARFAASYGDYYRDYIEVLIELNQREDAFNTLERSRARSLLSMLAERDLVFTTDIPANLEQERKLSDFEYDKTQGKLRELSPKQNAKEIEESLNHLRELRQQQEEIAERIKKVSPKYASLQYPQPLDLAGTLAALDPRTLLLSYCVGKEKSFLFAVSADPNRGSPLSVFTLSIGEKALRQSVEAFRKLIEWNKPSSDLISRSRSLYDTLIRPAEALIAKADRILILPDSPLHTLPFGALIRDVKGGKPQYLVERKPVHTAVSATVYAELKRSRRQQPVEPPILVAGFGDPRYPKLARPATGAKRGDGAEETAETPEDSDQDPNVRVALRGGYRFDPLPHSREEVQSITSLYAPRSEAFLGDEATEERAKSLGKDIPLIHFACHAFVNERFPLDSALALTIPEKPKEGQDNGLLQAWEIFEKVRIDADLVTLSACESGLGKEMGGEGLIGLTRAFQYAGARSILASLWKVEDQSTGELMRRFYGYLKAGKTKDEALRAAQINLIHSPDLAQPVHWAAFQLIGDWK